MILLLFLISLATTPQYSDAQIVQTSTGWCSPNIANVTGPVRIICKGVDPRALAVLNAELRRKRLDLESKIREANKWAKKYHELEKQLGQDDSIMSRSAENYLHEGNLVKAEALLKQITASEEKDVSRTAENHFSLALIYELQFQPVRALPEFEFAYRYRPEVWKYGLAYAHALLDERDYSKAGFVLSNTLEFRKAFQVWGAC